MTKILHIPEGKFIRFKSHHQGTTFIIEESMLYNLYYFNNADKFFNAFFNSPNIIKVEYEIIYD